MRVRRIITGVAVAATTFLTTYALAQTQPPRLIQDAQYGVVREVRGALLPIVGPDKNCPQALRSSDERPTALPQDIPFVCFAAIKSQLSDSQPLRVMAFAYVPQDGMRVSGVYTNAYTLYDVWLADGGVQSRPVEMNTSSVRVPVGCYSLNGEAVSYIISGKTALESQYVVCDGGPRQPRGPYAPEGPVLIGQGQLYRQTEEVMFEGTPRWLAYPGVACEKVYSPRKDYCATEAITYLQQNPDVKELDLIAARIPVRGGDVLTGKQVDQWVLKRRGKNGFKADSRWRDQFWLGTINGCWPITATRWNVIQTETGLHIQEQANGWCGAPSAPVPTEIWEMYGTRDYFIVDCAEDRRGWRERHEANGACLHQAGDYLRNTQQSSATVIVLNQRGRVGDLLIPGGYISYDVARASLNSEGKLVIERDDYFTPEAPYQSNCNAITDGPPESKGFILVRSMGVTFARSMRWMECRVY